VVNPLVVKSRCALDEAGLYEHIRLALERGLPLVLEQPKHEATAILVAPGPSVRGYLEKIRQLQKDGHPIVAITSAHDWLMENDIIPDYAVAIDPLPEQKRWFQRKNVKTRYMVGSQCHPDTFDYFEGCKVFLWHLYVREGQTYPPNSELITGGTTAGLRAINLFYAIGFRSFVLYGYDSCLSKGQLRIGGTDNGDKTIEVICGGETFLTTPPMAAQASEFQNLFACMPDIAIESHGYGIITKILEERTTCVFSSDLTQDSQLQPKSLSIPCTPAVANHSKSPRLYLVNSHCPVLG
jgi:hypothetical protein